MVHTLHPNLISYKKILILYYGTSSYLSLFCLECAYFMLSAANMYVCLSLSKQVMPSSEPRYLNFGCKKVAKCSNYGSRPKIKNEGIPMNAHWGTN